MSFRIRSRSTSVALFVAFFALAVRAENAPPPGAAAPDAPAPPPAREGLPLPEDRGDLFSASGLCAPCHNSMSDESGADVSIDSFWRSTTMANAARDPYWMATVRAEVLAHPKLQSVIEEKCAKCHMPMAATTAAARGEPVKVLDDGFSNPKHPMHALAMDGVSCTVCHQIEESGFGTRASFSGGYTIDKNTPAGERKAYGPFPFDKDLAEAMKSLSGFVPVRTEHMKRSELCATCHNLYTPFVDANGEVKGEFPEQTVYFEYAHSDFRQRSSCRDCHMPEAKGAVQLAVSGGDPRKPFARHEFVGGNAYMVEMLEESASELGVTASDEHFDRTVERARDLLLNRTAKLSLEKATLKGTRLSATVSIRSLTGHKMPTSFPSRRAWIRFTVTDRAGKAVFESGSSRDDGFIEGNDNDQDASRFEPHYNRIERPDQVQIYEAILGDTDRRVTTTLLRAATYLKDNRLLPSGFSKAKAPADIAVHGEALADTDFVGGGDKVTYSVDTAGRTGPFTVTAELVYQSIGYRWADNLRAYKAPEVERFSAYYAKLPNRPLRVALASVRVPK